MADLIDEYRILYSLYLAELRGITISDLRHNFEFMDKVGRLDPALSYLRKNNYIEGPDNNLQITGKGLQTITSFFRKFYTYLKAHRNEDLSTWINSLDLNKNNIRALMRDAYNYIETKTPVNNAFKNYIDEVVSIENVMSFEIHEVNLGELIDEIFMNIYDVNMMFEQRFKNKLFCQSPAAQPHLNGATRSRIDLPAVVATIASVIDGICYKEIDVLLGSHKVDGSISKIQKLLDINSVSYDVNTINRLRTLHKLRVILFQFTMGVLMQLNIGKNCRYIPIVDVDRL